MRAAEWRLAEARRRALWQAGGIEALLAAGEMSPAVAAILRAPPPGAASDPDQQQKAPDNGSA